jgi:hypothetical protein
MGAKGVGLRTRFLDWDVCLCFESKSSAPGTGLKRGFSNLGSFLDPITLFEVFIVAKLA